MRSTKTGSENGYLTNCEYIMERQGDYKAMKEVTALFEPTTEEKDGHGSLCGYLAINKTSKKAQFSTDRSLSDDSHCGLYRAIPSALLMYRLACLFGGSISTLGQEGYKFAWQMRLKHKESGHFITFGEWKGGSLFWTDEMDNKEFKRDILKLINLLVSDHCPHPYDGTVAGSVA